MKQRIQHAHESVSKRITYHFRLCCFLFSEGGWVVFFFLGSLLIGLCIINSSILDRFLEVDFFFLQWDSWHFMTIYCTLPETNRHRPGKYPGKGDSYWKPPLLGDIVVSGRDIFYYHRNMFLTIQLAIFQVQRTLQNAFSPHPCC